MSRVRVYAGDALAVMRRLPAGSFDLVATDPPYCGVKEEKWDNQWASPADYLAWIGDLCAEWARLLRPTGSLYLFASPQMAGRVECKVAETFNVLNNIVWVKGDANGGGLWARAEKDALRSFFPRSERIIFAEHYGADSYAAGESGYQANCDQARGFVFDPIRVYLRSEWERAGMKAEDANTACGTASMAGRHYFTQSQWCMPTREHYQAMQRYANRNGGEFLRRDYEYLRRDYEDLRRDYEDLREEYESLRRPFTVTADDQYTDCWTAFPTVAAYPGKHPCEKPATLMEHIILTSTLPGARVLDPFCGSGATGAACKRLGRDGVLVDNDRHWVEVARDRVAHAEDRQLELPGLQQERRCSRSSAGQMRLL